MKRLLAIVLCFALLLPLSSCRSKPDEISFYYPRLEYEYGAADGLIAYEYRDVSGHRDDLTYILNMYLEGPLDDTLENPFPRGTALLGFTYSASTLYVTLNDVFAQLEGMDHTIASACMAYTCFQLTAAQQVVIKCNSDTFGNKSITLSRDTLLTVDTSEVTE